MNTTMIPTARREGRPLACGGSIPSGGPIKPSGVGRRTPVDETQGWHRILDPFATQVGDLKGAARTFDAQSLDLDGRDSIPVDRVEGLEAHRVAERAGALFDARVEDLCTKPGIGLVALREGIDGHIG